MGEKIIFHDMPGNINLENGVVQIDFYDKKPSAAGMNFDENPYAFGCRLVLSLPACLNLYKMLGEIVEKLEKEGVIQQEETPGGAK